MRAQESGQLTRAPKLIRFVPAAYPTDKHDAGVTAKVMLAIEIGDDGKVQNVEVVEGAGADFDAAAVDAARQFVFEPAEIDGKPTPVKITYRYDFTIITETVAVGPQINYEGVVLERFKKRPIPRVTVKIKDLNVAGTTDDEGHFAFTDVPMGVHKVELSHPRLITVATEETIKKGAKLSVKYLVEEKEEGVDEEVVVRASRIKKEAVETRIRTEEARRVPGTQGDTLKVVQNLPGVGRSAFGSGALVVWGAAPKETRVNVDGVEIPSIYHVGGYRSTVNSDLVRSIDLSPGSYGAEYGRGLGGLVRIDLRPLPAEGVHGYVASDIMDTSGMISVAATRRLRLAIAGRFSYLDRLFKGIGGSDIDEFYPVPRYDDYQVRAGLTLGKDEDLYLTLLGSDDHIRKTIPSGDPSETRDQDTDLNYKRLILRYTRLLPDGSSLVVTPSVGVDNSDLQSNFGIDKVTFKQRTWQAGLRSFYRRKVSSLLTLALGVDAQGRQTHSNRNGSVNLPAREGDIVVFGQRPGSDTAVDDWSVLIMNLSPYFVADLNLGKLTITPSLRFEPTWVAGDRRLPHSDITPPVGYASLLVAENPFGGSPVLRALPNPRVQASYRATSRLTFTVGGGIYGQAPDPEDMSPVFGNPALRMSTALHSSGGFAFKIRPTLSLESVGFYKKLYDLVSRSPAQSPPVAQALTQDGTGRSYGLQVLLRQELLKGFFGWITYSLIRSERQDHPSAPYRLFDYDQTHVLAVLGSYDFGRGWEMGGRFRYSTGMPRTPVAGAFLNSRTGFYEPIFGPHNSIRIPAFYQLDFRLEKAFVMARTKISLFLDLQNLTNRKNSEEIIYSEDFRVKSYITGLPVLAVVGARVEF